MHAITFDTLKFAQRLRDEVKLPPEQAEKYASLMQDTLATTLTDFREQQEVSTKGDVTTAKTELLIAIDENKTAIEKSKSETIKWLITLILAQSAFIYGIARLHG
jgi:hypothetical protein